MSLPLTYEVGSGTITVATTDRHDAEHRPVYFWRVSDGETSDHGWDLYGPANGSPSRESAMSALVSFLGAAAESSPGGENAGLFSPAIVEWARHESDEIAMLALDLDPHV